MKNTNTARYKLFAQNRSGELIFENLEQKNYFIRLPEEVLADKNLQQDISQEDMVIIKAAADFN